jgi:hypothetical protein
MQGIQFYDSFKRKRRRQRAKAGAKFVAGLVLLAIGVAGGPAVFFAMLVLWNVANGFNPITGYFAGANALYDAGRAAFLTADIDIASDDIVVALVAASGYTPNLATHDFLNDISGGAIIATSNPLTTKTTTAGVFDADDVLLASVPAGLQGDYLILYMDSGSSSTSPLIGKIDTGTNLPVTPNGGDINIAWSSGANKIFKL